MAFLRSRRGDRAGDLAYRQGTSQPSQLTRSRTADRLPVLPPRILPCGDAAVSVEFGDAIDPGLNARVLALDEALRRAAPKGVVETVPTYRSLLVHFDPLATDHDALTAFLEEQARSVAPLESTGRRWRVPVVYGGAFGEDLDDLAGAHGLTAAEVIERHAGAVYRIYMIGFLPGFAYLGGLDPALATPRRTQPRARIPAGSVAIGGAQTAISSIEGPSGWHLLGRTPVRSYDPGREPAFLLAAGDEVVFEPVDPSRWDDFERAAQAGQPVAEQVHP
ncbi:5-oxoprolinase subunit PxpB [Microvirga pudoricolor]|uniref:5-oxoprolinase subunit PxpB n=1 Tax=Microvirga pudoricolor TaxID=2778729 RepID=UPI0019513EA6|nr:5-oxoprolinase subunit PxpB [Microvirga pudoricolor]MBM6592454.1 5-oxoprolinase subunit PxpB [Microvirga pudoricolor]